MIAEGSPQHERPPELDAHDSPCLRAPSRVEHHAQEAIDTEPRMPEAGGRRFHFAFGPTDYRLTLPPGAGSIVWSWSETGC